MYTFTLLLFLNLPAATPTPIDIPEPQFSVQEQATQPQAPAATQTATSKREFFISWGYNGNGYSKSDIHFSQPSLGNDFKLLSVQAHDSKAWTDLWNHAPTVPQYNLRVGLFLNEKWGVEMTLDHIKWIVTQDQQVRMTGTLNNAPVDTQVVLTEDVLKYQLNNGANPTFFNLIRRFQGAGQPHKTGWLTFQLKGGAGFAVPHTENTLFGQDNDAGFQWFQGWNLDAGAAARIHLWRFIYVEVEDKFIYARYFGVNIDQGKASHSVKANEFSFHFGVSFH